MQYVANALCAAALICLVGIGIQVIYKTSRFFHLGHGSVLPVAAYLVHTMANRLGWPLALAVLGAIVGSIVAGVAFELLVFRPLRHRGAKEIGLLLASLALYTIIVNVLAAVFGDVSRSIRSWPVEAGNLVWGARITGIQVVMMFASCVGVCWTWLILHHTHIGKRLRAVSSDPELAKAVGIEVDSAHIYAIAWGTFLGAVAGILMAFDVGITPHMGMSALMYAVVAMVVGGNTLWGVVGGSLALAGALQTSVLWIPARWQDAIALAILIAFLLLWPRGLLGRPLKKVAV